MPLGEVGDFGHRDAKEIHREADALAVEIAGGEVLLGVVHEERIVAAAVGFGRDDAADVFERVERGAECLRRAADAVPVLHLAALVGHDLALGEELEDILGDGVSGPRWGRTRWTSGWKARSTARRASMVMAAAIMAFLMTRSASKASSAAPPVIIWEPLIRPRPSL